MQLSIPVVNKNIDIDDKYVLMAVGGLLAVIVVLSVVLAIKSN